jgi:hypothetical protein
MIICRNVLFHFDQLSIGPIKIVCLQQEKWIRGVRHSIFYAFSVGVMNCFVREKRTNRQLIKMKQVRETSYLTILRPTLEYAAMVCDPTT